MARWFPSKARWGDPGIPTVPRQSPEQPRSSSSRHERQPEQLAPCWGGLWAPACEAKAAVGSPAIHLQLLPATKAFSLPFAVNFGTFRQWLEPGGRDGELRALPWSPGAAAGRAPGNPEREADREQDRAESSSGLTPHTVPWFLPLFPEPERVKKQDTLATQE